MVSCWVGALPGWAVPIELAQGQLASDASLRIAMMSDGRLLCGDRPPPATAPRCHRRVAFRPARGTIANGSSCLEVASAACDWSYRRRGAGMSVFTAAELACLRQKPRLARIAAVTLFRPRVSCR